MANGDVHDQISDQYLQQFDRSIGVSGMQKLQSFPQLQKLGYAGQLGSMKGDFHGLTEFKSQMAKYSSVSHTLKIAYALIAGVIPNNAVIARKLFSTPELGTVGKDFQSIHGFGQVFALNPTDLQSPQAVQSKASVFSNQSVQSSVIENNAGSTQIGGAGLIGGSTSGGGGGSTTLAGLLDVSLSSPTDGQVLTFNASTGKWVNAAPTGGSGSSTGGYTTTIGDGTHTSYVIDHALNSTEVIVQVHETTSFKRVVDVEIDISDTNHVTIIFGSAPALNAYTVVVLSATSGGGGGGGSDTDTLATLSDVLLTSPSSGQFLQFNGTNWVNHTPAIADLSDGTNIVTAITTPGVLFNTPVTITSHTAAFSLINQTANLVFAGPATGAAATPTFRSLVTADFPTIGGVAGSYTNSNITVDATGRITVASNGSGGGGAAGTTVSTTNTSYTTGQRQTFDLTMAKSFLAWLVTEATGKKFRLQLYETSAARTADSTRPFTVPLPLGTQHGCLLDLYIEQSLVMTPFKLSPPIVGSNNDGTQATTIYAVVTSVELATQNIQVTISYVPLES